MFAPVLRTVLCGLTAASLLAFIPLTAAQENAVNNELPQVLLKTTKGDVVIELYEDEAPNTVANFVSLVEKKFYNGLTFHRVLDGFMAQGGCPKGTGTEGPGYCIPCECYQANARKHEKGVLAMAHAGRDTGGSQFYITFVETPHLNGKHTVFGKVIKGMDAVEKLQRIDPSRRDPNTPPDKITEATMVKKRDHKYEPKTLPSRR